MTKNNREVVTEKIRKFITEDIEKAMVKSIRKTVAMSLAAVISISTFATAFATEIAPADIVEETALSEEVTEETVEQETEEQIELVNAEITNVPLKNLIVFGPNPNSPEGITVEIEYSDGTVVTEKIVKDGTKYYVNGERVHDAAKIAVAEYGFQNDVFFMKNGKIKISYKYFAIPSLANLFSVIF